MNENVEILDGPKTISLAVGRESSTYSLNVLGLVAGYQYNFTVSLILLCTCTNMFHYECLQVRGKTNAGYGSNSTPATIELSGVLNLTHPIHICMYYAKTICSPF